MPSIAASLSAARSFSFTQGIGVNVPDLVQQGDGNRNDALIYTSIQTMDQGTDPRGIPIRGGKSWALPAPIDILDLHSASYEGINFAESKVLQNAMKSGGVAGGMAQGFISLLKGIGSGIFSPSGSDSLIGTKAMVGQGNIYNQYSTATRTGINPNTELAYRGPNLRQIQFSFRITPFSQRDANNLYNFISYMRKMIYPVTDDTVWGMGYPAKFAISVNVAGKGGESSVWSNKRIFSMGHGIRGMKGTLLLGGVNEEQIGCVLTDMQVSYGELGTYAGHVDGSPSIANITLTFQENLVSTRESIEKEYG